MNRWIVTAGVAAGMAVVLAGCGQPELKQSKQEAHARWQNARGRVAHNLAEEQFKNGQLDRALAKAQEAVSLAPEDGEARLLLGEIFIEQSRYLQAVPELQKACARLPKAFEPPFMLGVALERAGRLDDALVSYQKSLDVDPGNLNAVMAGAEVLVALGRVADARCIVDAYLGSAGQEPAMYELAGRLARMTDDPARASELFAQALDLDPANIRYRESLAEAQFLCGRHEEAADTLRSLIQTPKYAAPAWAQAMLGDCCLAMGRLREARLAYVAARDLAPTDARSWVNLAKVSLENGESPRAEASAREALRLEPRNLDATMVLASALLKQGQARQAIAVLAPAAKKHGGQVVLQCLLGKAYAEAGDLAAAARCYTEALKAAPDNPLARELLAAAERRQSPAAIE
jgi:tetratricopeptide (TPR) repeat protein